MNLARFTHPGRLRRPVPMRQQGSGLVETLIGTAIAAVALTGLCVANANCLSITRAHRELIIADQCLQQRAEEYRAANWRQVTDPNSALTLMQQTPPSSNYSALQNQTETITVTPYPEVTPAVTPLVVTRDTTGASAITSQPALSFNLRYSAAVRIDIRESWTSSQGQRPRSQAITIVIVLGGLLH